MFFIITNIAVELVLNSVWWLVRKIIYGLTNYLFGLVYKRDNKFYIDEQKWNNLIEQNRLQEKEIHQLREIVEKWTDLKSSTINNDNYNQSQDEINDELVNYLKESIMEKS
jgi:hypothetical protein